MVLESTADAPIPQPPKRYLGLLGNLPDIDVVNVHPSFAELAKEYGEIYQLELGSGRTVVVSTQELCNEIADEKRFYKAIANTNNELRNLMGDGIFTSHTSDHAWKVAHRILMPIFGPLAIKAMFPQMMEIASQLILKWDRFGSRQQVHCVNDFTRLTLDTIALTGFGYRFNSLYRDDTHPFVESMTFCQVESGRRANRMKLETQLRLLSKYQYFSNIQVMHDICDEVVKERKEHPQEIQDDLLSGMLNNSDPETGEKLSDENIRYQMVTFLVSEMKVGAMPEPTLTMIREKIAGHETTSGLLGFCTYNMLKHPETFQKAREEVDRVLGDEPLEAKHLGELKYIEAILRETLRLYPTAPGWSVHCYENTTLAGKYQVKPEDRILVSLLRMQRDPKVWGNDAEEFKPERMLNGGFDQLPPNAWKPFGNGARACIGRLFALQEATIVLALMLQRFDLEFWDPNYQLGIQSTLTIKPADLKIRVRRRSGKSIWVGLSTSSQEQMSSAITAKSGKNEIGKLPSDAKVLQIFYGSNQGTCRGFADTIQNEAASYGFNATVQKLDDAAKGFRKNEPVLVVTSSYEGNPPENAKKFISWLNSEDAKKDSENLEFAVFGVGSSDWPLTFHQVPKLVQTKLEALGGRPLLEIGLANAAGDLVSDFESWKENFWQCLAERYDVKRPDSSRPKLDVVLRAEDRRDCLGEKDMSLGKVLSNKELAPKGVGFAKRHIEIELPEGKSYRSGDYLAILPMNHPDSVRRILRHFCIPDDAIVQTQGASKSFLPNEPLPAFILLRDYVELATPISKHQLAVLRAGASKPQDIARLEAMQTLHYEKEVLENRASIIDVLMANPSCQLSFGSYVDMLQPLKARQYSISSAPLHEAKNMSCSLTFDVFDDEAYTGNIRFHGVASSFLASLQPGDMLHCAIKPTIGHFRLPEDDGSSAPIIMISTGTGIAPMRAFVQELQQQKNRQRKCLFYYGCRYKHEDFLYGKELEEAERQGIVSLRPTFSRDSQSSKGFKYVGDRILDERKEVWDLIEKGAKLLLCGSARKLSHSVNTALIKIYCEQKALSSSEGDKWLQTMKQDRYATDIFG